VNYVLIPRESEIGAPMYERLDAIVNDHHEDLRRANARIALAWQLGLKPDVDGRLVLGRCRKSTDLDRELFAFDFVILLNRDFWQNPRVTDEQRDALLDHEVCHCGISYDETGEPKVDDRGRTVFRTVKHSIEEFTEVIERHGVYKSDLEGFARALRRAERTAASTWVGFESLRDRLAVAGADVPLDRIVEWSERERHQADSWARLEIELHDDELQAPATNWPPHVAAAAVNPPMSTDVARQEHWLAITDYPDYEVSDLGRVRRITSRTVAKAGHVLRTPLRSGYPCVDLSRDGEKKTHHVHRLVATAFVVRGEGANEVNHVDGVKTNNRAANLEWVTRSENALHAFRTGLSDATGENNGFSKLTEPDVERIRSLVAQPNRPSYQNIAEQFGVTESNIRSIASRRSWNHPSQEISKLRDTLAAIGVTVDVPTIATWSDDERREVHTWALLRQEVGERANVALSQTMPACLAAAVRPPSAAAAH
jgi:hypothetical protein